MRERIESGQRVDLFASADIGHARKLVDDGQASIMAVFARNTVCLLSPAKFGLTSETALDKLLAPGVRIGISPPKVDPLGDYTMRLFDAAERLRPGSATSLRARSVVVDTPPGRREAGVTQPLRAAFVATKKDLETSNVVSNNSSNESLQQNFRRSSKLLIDMV